MPTTTTGQNNYAVTLSAFEDWNLDALAKGADASFRYGPLGEFVRSIETMAMGPQAHHLAWAKGCSVDYASRGIVARAVLGSATLGSGLRRLVQFYPLIQEGTSLTLTIEDDFAAIGYRILDPDIWPRRCDALYTLGLHSQIVRRVAAGSWDRVEISLEGDDVESRGDLERITGASVILGGVGNSLRFPVEWLDRPLALIEPPGPALLRHLSDELVRHRRAQPAVKRVEQTIFMLLGTGSADQRSVSRELGLTSRTLRRRLAGEGTSFQAVLDRCRMRLAVHELRSRRMVSLSELALKLGFSEHSTFSRAFARWMGEPPQEYRRHVTMQ